MVDFFCSRKKVPTPVAAALKEMYRFYNPIIDPADDWLMCASLAEANVDKGLWCEMHEFLSRRARCVDKKKKKKKKHMSKREAATVHEGLCFVFKKHV